MIFYFIESLLTLPLLYAILSTIVEFRSSKKKCLLVISIAVCATFILDFLMFLSGTSTSEMYSRAWITTCIPSFLSLLYLAKYRDLSFFFAFLTECVLASICTTLSSITAYYLPVKHNMLPIIVHVFFLTIIYLLCRKLFREKYYIASRAQGRLWILYCLLPLFSLIFWAMFRNSPTTTNENTVFLPYIGHIQPQILPMLISLLIIAFYVVVLIMYMIITTYGTYQEREAKNSLKIYLNSLNKRVIDIEEKNKSLRILRHDFRHHINTIRIMLKNDEKEKAYQYLVRFDKALSETTDKKYCLNAVINAVLSSYIAEAEASNISVDPIINIPEYLPIDDMDIGVVISNALENALIACSKQPASKRKHVDFKFIRHKKQYIVDITNPFSGTILFDDDGHPVSKEENHGIGSRSILTIAKKYNATVDYSTENGLFNLRFMFTE